MDIQTYVTTTGQQQFHHLRYERVLDPAALEILREVVAVGRKIENYKKAGCATNLDRKPHLKEFVHDENVIDLKGTPQSLILGILGLVGESSELAEVLLDSLSNGYSPEIISAIVNEQGDNLWYHIPLCDGTTIPIQVVMKENHDKLEARYQA